MQQSAAQRTSHLLLDRQLFVDLELASFVLQQRLLAPPTLPGFYPHSEWAALGPVHVGVRSKPRSITAVMDLGCWALQSNRRSLKDQPVTRSHPNKAVDVAFNQTSEKQP